MYKKICIYFGLVFLAAVVISACGKDELLLDNSPGAALDTEQKVDAFTDGVILPVEVGQGKTMLNICVHVCGAVEEPGVYELPTGSRIYEAVDAAGGFDEEADREAVNLVEGLEDGEQIRIPFIGEIDYNPGSGLIDINTADMDELCKIPGIGESRAQAIIKYRESQGEFQSKEELMQVPGIKEGIYGRISSYVECK